MKLITRDTDYAIRAVCYISRKRDKITSVSELVRELKIPRPFLRKILQRLNKEKLLKSHKGQGGGFILAISPDKLSLIGLINIFQGQLKLNECLFKRNICPNTRNCALKRKLDTMEKYVVKGLRSITIASLLR